jgi:FtsP/CotA-like multicopper oxidase with cupredoxin domain
MTGHKALAYLLALSTAAAVSAVVPRVLQARPVVDADPRVQWNDNEESAGQLEDGRLQVNLEVRREDWHPLGPDEPAIRKLAFAETGEPAKTPGPLIRTTEGTEVRATVTNPLEVPLEVQGLASRHDPDFDRGQISPGDDLPWVHISPGETEVFQFTADERGTYFYRARVPGDTVSEDEEADDGLLSGALIVDPDGKGPAENEKVMVVQQPEGYLTINGRPWPHTERLTYDLGDEVTYRVINDTEIAHPMHLHGFFYTVESQGDIAESTVYGPTQRQKAVTETVRPDGTLKLSWSPDRPGGWIFHCHISFDIMPNVEVSKIISEEPPEFINVIRENLRRGDPEGHSAEGMGGMVMGIYVRPPEDWTPPEPEGEPVRIYLRKDSIPGNLAPRFGAALAEPGEAPPPSDKVPFPGPPLVLHEGEPAPIRVINQTDEPTILHWHGLEVESLYDGVAGVTGYRGRRSPPVKPGEKYDVLLRTDRPGTYIYHTHMSDIRQQGGGLYGPLLVLPEGEDRNPETDRVKIVGNGFGEIEDLQNVTFLNGTTDPDSTEMTVGTTYRLRFINIALGGQRTFRLARNGFPVEWRPLAQDAWKFPAHQRDRTDARIKLDVGETYDVTYTPERPGELTLQVGLGDQVVEQPIRVKEAP